MFAESDGNFGHFKLIFTSFFFFVIAVGFRYYSFSMGGLLSFPLPSSQATFRSAPDNESSNKKVHPH